MRCQLCGEETFTEEELKELFDKMACRKCITEFEKGDDEFHFRCLKNRKGVLWILKQLFS